MIYIIDQADFTMFQFLNKETYQCFLFWETTEERIKGIIENNRTRTIINKKEITNLFSVDGKVQMADRIKKLKLKEFDKVIVFTDNRYFVLQVMNYSKWENAWKEKHL